MPLIFPLKIYTAISRKVVGKNVHATILKGNMGYGEYVVPNDCSCRTCFCCFSVALADMCPWPLLPFFQISLKNSELETTHNTFRDCRVHIFSDNISRNSCKQLTTPENTITYHNALCLSPQNFA